MKTVILVILCFCTFVKPQFVKEGCPLNCKCSKTDDGIEVWCDSGYLTNFPKIKVNATSIKINGNHISTIPNDAFSEAGNFINTINLRSNAIENIMPYAFEGLSKVKSMSLLGNNIKTMKESQIQHLLAIEMLSLGGNKLNNIDTFCTLTTLQRIFFTANNLSSAKFLPCYSNLKQLKVVYFNRNRDIKRIDFEDFRSLKNVNLSSLSFQACSLTAITNNTFVFLKELSILDLSENKLTYLSDSAFEGLDHLKSLNLQHNRFPSVPEQALLPLSHIEMLMIDVKKNWVVGSIFKRITNLEYLNLNGNLENLTNITFANLQKTQLKGLVMKKCHIHSIELGCFSPLPSTLQMLDISHNPINESQLTSAFYGLKTKFNITTLGLQHLNLEKVDPSLFKYLTNRNKITKLDLSASGISIIKRSSFSKFPKVKFILLNSNKNMKLEPGAFENLPLLEKLDLSRCFLQRVPSAKYGEIPSNLKFLLLSRNILSSVQVNYWKNLSKLEYLDLSTSNLRSIGKDCWSKLTSLRFLDLSNNPFSSLLSVFTENSPSTLQNLNIDSHSIIDYENVTFSSFVDLITLHMKGKTMPQRDQTLIFKRLINPLKNIVNLNLQSNGIHYIPNDMFLNNKNLSTLGLSSNYISSWDPIAFQPLSKLKVLSLLNNRIPYINQTSFIYLKSLNFLTLSNNPLSCRCALRWFRNVFLVSDNVFIIGIGKKGAYTCNSPPQMQGKDLLDFKISEKDCVDQTQFKLSISIPVVFIAVILLISITVRYRWYLRYWIFLLKARRRQYDRHENEYRYDAFVGYNNKDSDWVFRHLLPTLEYNDEFQLCLHDRDWLAGNYIADNIVESIENSRKTILVLTANFAQSEWCQLELAMAQHKLFHERANVIVPVLLEDIPQRLITPNMRALLTRKTYIKWPNNRRKQQLFWKGLKLALTRRDPARLLEAQVI